MNQHPPTYGLLAEFESEQALVAAVRRIRETGYKAIDAYTPYPVDDLEEALQLPRMRVPLIVLVGGITGALTAYLMEWYANVISYPMNIGGRPHDSWPAFIPITFELTVLFAALFGVVGMLVLNRLPEPYHPVFNVPEFARATQDAFFVCIESTDPLFSPETTPQLLSELQPCGVWDIPL